MESKEVSGWPMLPNAKTSEADPCKKRERWGHPTLTRSSLFEGTHCAGSHRRAEPPAWPTRLSLTILTNYRGFGITHTVG